MRRGAGSDVGVSHGVEYGEQRQVGKPDILADQPTVGIETPGEGWRASSWTVWVLAGAALAGSKRITPYARAARGGRRRNGRRPRSASRTSIRQPSASRSAGCARPRRPEAGRWGRGDRRGQAPPTLAGGITRPADSPGVRARGQRYRWVPDAKRGRRVWLTRSCCDPVPSWARTRRWWQCGRSAKRRSRRANRRRPSIPTLATSWLHAKIGRPGYAASMEVRCRARAGVRATGCPPGPRRTGSRAKGCRRTGRPPAVSLGAFDGYADPGSGARALVQRTYRCRPGSRAGRRDRARTRWR